MTDYYFNSRFGNDTSNNGLLPGSAWRSINKFNTTTFAAGDTIYFAEGCIFVGAASINDNGTALNPINIKSYKDGSGKTAMPIFSNPDTIASNPRCLEILGDYIYVEGIDFRDAEEAAIEIFQTNDNNRVSKCQFNNVGIGIRCKGNNNEIFANFFFDLKMSSNLGNSSDVGGICVSLEKNASNTNTGNKIYNNMAINGKAMSVQFNNDGGFVEIFRGCTNFEVYNNYVKNCKGFMEVGGDNTGGDTISGGLVYNNVVVDCYGIICYFNTKGGSFSVDIADHGIKFYGNDFFMKDRSASAIFFAGNWTGTPVDYVNNWWRGHTTFIATDGSTTLNTILLHTNNRYNRFSGTQTDLGTGYTLGTGETTGSAGVVDESKYDFKITTSSALYQQGTAVTGWTTDILGNPRLSPPSIGAYEFKADVLTPASAGIVVANTHVPMSEQSAYPTGYANNTKGGYHAVASYTAMLAIPTGLRSAGMKCYVIDIDMEFRLGIDLVSWNPIPKITDFRPVYSAYFVDSKASGTAGGGDTATIGAWNTRALNAQKYDDGIDCRLSSGDVILNKPAAYLLSAGVILNRTNRAQMRIRDVTKSRTIAVNPNRFATSASSINAEYRVDRYLYVTDQVTTLRLENWIELLSTTGTPTGSNTYGLANTTGEEEIYAWMRIELAR